MCYTMVHSEEAQEMIAQTKPNILHCLTDLAGPFAEWLVRLIIKEVGEYHFIAKDSFINDPDTNGQTPLYRACRIGNRARAKTLMTHGADVNKPDMFGTTPLQIAATYGHADVVRDLLHEGAHPIPDCMGRSLWELTKTFVGNSAQARKKIQLYVRKLAEQNNELAQELIEQHTQEAGFSEQLPSSKRHKEDEHSKIGTVMTFPPIESITIPASDSDTASDLESTTKCNSEAIQDTPMEDVSNQTTHVTARQTTVFGAPAVQVGATLLPGERRLLEQQNDLSSTQKVVPPTQKNTLLSMFGRRRNT